MIENWVDIDGFEGLYQVSDLGRVRSLAKSVRVVREGKEHKRAYNGKTMRLSKSLGYLYVRLTKDGVCKTQIVHRLVAIAFVKRIRGKNHVNHINFNGFDNRAVNLEWMTRSENQLHSVRGGRGAYGKAGWKIQDRLKSKQV